MFFIFHPETASPVETAKRVETARYVYRGMAESLFRFILN